MLLDGVAAQEKRHIVIIFWELRIQKKGEERGQKLVRNLDPFLVPFSIGTFLEGSENGPIFGPAFWCRRATFEPVLGTANGATVSSAMQLSNSKL